MINGWATALSSKGIDGFCGSKGTRTNGARSSYCGRGQAGSRGSEGRMPLLNEEVKLGDLPQVCSGTVTYKTVSMFCTSALQCA